MLSSLLEPVNLAVETALVFAVALLAAAGRSAPFRVMLFRCAFVVALAAPIVLMVGAPKIGIVTLPVTQEFATPAPMAFPQPSPAFEQAGSIVDLAVIVWLVGALVVFGRYLLSLRFLSRAFAAGRPITSGLQARANAFCRRLSINTPVALRVSDRVPAPCTFGWLRPKVLLPVATHADGLDSILAHELCHIRNRDALWLMLAQIACALHWFNPLVWFGARRHREDIELVCDDDAAHTGIGVEIYASALVRAARDLIRPSASAAVMMSGRGLAGRVRALLARARPMAKPALGFKITAICFSLAAVLALSTTGLVSANPAQGQDPVEAMLSERTAPEPGHGRVQIRVPDNVSVRAEAIGFACWGAARCQFEEPLGAEILLHASASRAGSLVWDGCQSTEDAGGCRVQIGERTQQVSVRLRR